MRLPEAELLDDLKFSVYEKKALLALVDLGIADAGTLCREGEIPSSKIYRSMERLVELGLAQIQPARPKHLTRLTASRRRILSYLERGDLEAIDRAVTDGFPVLRRISRNAAKHGVEHQIVFGFSLQSAPVLVDFLRRHRSELAHSTGIRYSGELGHPFHVIDDRTVVLPLDHPFVPEGRFASMLVEDAELAQNLTTGFQGLWRKAMRDLREIDFHPGIRPPGATRGAGSGHPVRKPGRPSGG